MQYAGFLRRLVAYIIDIFVLYAAYFAVGLVLAFGFGGIDIEPQPAAGRQLPANLFGLVVSWLYFALMESSAKQGTLGKMAIGIKVTDLAGARIGFGRATGRFFGKVLSGLLLLIGYIMAAFTKKKQALHDILAGTLVVVR